MARWLAFLLAAGGGLILVVIVLPLLPVPDTTDRLGSAVVACSSIALGAAVWVLGHRITKRAAWGLLVVATGIVTLGAYFWGAGTSDASMFYVWIVVYAAYFFGGRATAAYLLLIGAAYAAVLNATGSDLIGTRFTLRMVTLGLAAAVIVNLVGRLRGTLADAEEAQADRERLLGQLATAALTDSLTGLPNRRAWDEQFERELARATRDESSLCVALLDLDLFKAYNDRHGHQAGDAMLRDVAQAWRKAIRGGDLLARYGGEEFVMLLPGCDSDEATPLVERVRAATPAAITVSTGMAVWDGEESAEDLVERADAALYRAKAGGRDRTVLAGPLRVIEGAA